MSLSSSFGLHPVLEAQFREIGYVFNPGIVNISRDLFKDSFDESLPDNGGRTDDVAYGEHERQRLDICSPGKQDQPIVLFIPGGGMTGGDKALYAHVPAFFARQGFVGVAMNYRLAPDFLFPAGAEDVGAAIDWLAQHGADFGGDPRRIFVVAQSAGAVHAASTIFDKRVRARHHDAIRAAVLMSGIYEIIPDHEAGNINLYFGNDAEELRDRSAVNHVDDTVIPIIVTVSEMEPAYFGLSAAALTYALTRCDKRPAQLVWLKGHNHLSPVLNMGASGDELGPAIADALRSYP